ACQRTGQPGPHGDRVLLVGALGGVDDVHDVDVGDVVELTSTGLAHADDGELHTAAVVGQIRAGHSQGGVQCRSGEVGERGGHAGEGGIGVGAGEVDGRDGEQPTTVAAAQGVHTGRAGDGGDGDLVVG